MLLDFPNKKFPKLCDCGGVLIFDNKDTNYCVVSCKKCEWSAYQNYEDIVWTTHTSTDIFEQTIISQFYIDNLKFKNQIFDFNKPFNPNQVIAKVKKIMLLL